MPGVVITPQAELLATDETFAPAIVNEVKKAVVDELGWSGPWYLVSAIAREGTRPIMLDVQAFLDRLKEEEAE